MIKEKELPEGWNVEEFGELFEFEKKSKYKASEGKKEERYKFFTSSNIQSKFINEFVFKGEYLIFGTGGNASIHYCSEEFSMSTDCLVAKTNMHIVKSKYVYYYLVANMHLLEGGFKGAGLKHISKRYIQKIKIPYPKDIEIQKKIVTILEKAEKLREWRREADKLSDDFLKSTFLEMFGDPIKNPKRWNLIKFDKAGTLARGKSKHRPRNAPELLGGKYPLIQTGDVANSNGYIRKYKQTYSELGLKQSKMWPAGTLCITIAANIAETGILTFDSCFPDSIVGFEPTENVRTEYVQFWLSFLQGILEKIAPESAQKNINLKILSNLDMPLPPIEVQNKFAEIVERIEQLREYQRQSKGQIDDLFNALMQKAFRGELVM